MNKILLVAIRDFKATVLTKAFLLGVVLTPVIIMISVGGIILLSSDKPPAVKGEVAIIDRTGPLASGTPLVAPGLEKLLKADAIAEAVGDEAKKIGEAGKEIAKRAGVGDAANAIDPEQLAKQAALTLPDLSTKVLPADASAEVEREPIRTSSPQGTSGGGDRLALVIFTPDAIIKPDGSAEFGSYELYVNEKLDMRVQQLLRNQIRRALLDARIAHAGYDPANMLAMTRVADPKITALSPTSERRANPAAQFILPIAFMLLVWIAVFSGGQTLLTNTIEEKSSRVMEVLLSAVSPTQLIAGKIIGQLCVGLLILCIYSGLGLVSLFAFAMGDLISFAQLGWLFVFFLIAYFLIASLMAAVGSAVSDLQEANTLLGPVMMVVMLPMLLMMPIVQNPGSTFALVTSFVPPINPFIMLLRVSSTDPPPFWQVALSAGIGIAASIAAVLMAGKIFRIGVLMYGKPPDFKTLVRWIRMA